jgi:hypothetical protein
VPKPPVISASGGKGGGGKPGGVAKYFDKALYFFEHPYRSSSFVLPPSSPQADLNNLSASATPPSHRRSYKSNVGGYYRFASASSQYFELANDVDDAAEQVFIACLFRLRGSGNGPVITRGYGTADHSILCYANATEAQMVINDGVADRVAAATVTLVPGKWYLLTGAYDKASYVKVGIDGAWLASTNITGSLANSATGFRMQFFNNAANGNVDMAFFGIGTTIPTDKQTRYIHWAIRNGVELPPPAGDTKPPPGDDPGDGGNTLGRMLLLGAG